MIPVAAMALVLAMMLSVTCAGAPPKVKLQYWHFLGGDIGKQHQALIDEFNKSNPDMEVSAIYSGTAWTMRDKLLTAVAGGVPPDVSLIDQFWAAQFAATGSIVKMQDFVTGPDGIDRQDVHPIAWATATVGTEIWTMPYAMSNIVLYYNKDAFVAANLDPNKPPTTWAELVTYAKALTRDVNGDGNIDEWGLTFPLRADEGTVYYWIAYLWQAGGEFYNKDFTETMFNSDEGVEALQYWIDLVHKHKVVPLAPPTEGFKTGRVAMQFASSAQLSNLQKQVKFQLGLAPMPSGKKKVTGVGGSNLAIFKTTPEKQTAAWKFVKWMSSPEVNLKWSTSTGYVPLRLSVLRSQAYKEFLKANPLVAAFVEQMDVAKPRPNVVSYADVSRVLGLAVERAVLSKEDPRKVLEQAAAEANDIIKSMMKK